MVEEDVRKAWGMVRQAAERLAEEAAKLETEATGDDVRDVSLLAAQRSARDLLDLHLTTIDRHYNESLTARVSHRTEDDVED
jgi:hypothetical protein